jgi:hypothetical protein
MLEAVLIVVALFIAAITYASYRVRRGQSALGDTHNDSTINHKRGDAHGTGWAGYGGGGSG